MSFKKTIEQQPYTVALILLAVAGMLISGYLWSVHINPESLTCSISGCEEVLTGEFAIMLGVPVAAFGFAFYSALLLLFVQRLFIKHCFLEHIIQAMLTVGALYTLYLRYIEFAKIGDWCEWCWGSVAVLVLIIVLYIRDRKSTRKNA